MGGPDQSNINTQNQIAASDLSIAQQQQSNSSADRAQRVALEQPAINKYTALSGGDRTAALQAAAPELGQIDQAGKATRESIFDSIGPGAGRDIALAGQLRDTNTQKASLVGNESATAADKLANIGSGLGSFSLQEVGAALSGNQGASGANQAVMQAQEQSKASTLGFLGSLAGAGGTALGGRP